MTKKFLSIIFLLIISNSYSQNYRELSMGKLVPLVLKLNWRSGKATYKVTGTKYKSIRLIGEERFAAKDWTVLAYGRGFVFKNKKEDLKIELYADMNIPYYYLDDPTKSGKSINRFKMNSFWTQNGRKRHVQDFVSITFYSRGNKRLDITIQNSQREKYKFDLNAEKFKY